MSLHQLKLDNNAVDVALSKFGTRLAVLSDRDLAVYATDMTKRPVPLPQLLWRSDSLEGHVPRQVAFVGEEQVYVLSDSWHDEESNLWTSQGEELIFCGPLLESGRASSVITSVDYQTCYVQFEDGGLYGIQPDDGQNQMPLESKLVQKFPSFAPEARICLLDGKVGTCREQI
jgi:elongator complex protein 1